MEKFAKLALKSYNFGDFSAVNGFEVIREYSDKYLSVLFNNQSRELVLSYSGTHMPSQIIPDFYIFIGFLNKSNYLLKLKRRTYNILDQLGHIASYIHLTGHSLGGSVVLYLSTTSVYDYVHGFWIYNPGFSLNSTLTDYFRKYPSDKIHIYRILGDPISILTSISPHQSDLIMPIQFDTHGIANFTN